MAEGKSLNVASWLSSFSNPYKHGIKKHVFELMNGRYTQEMDETLDRVCATISGDKDYQSLGALFVSIYDAGFQRAISQQEEVLKKAGFKVKLKTQEQSVDSKPIFQSEKSG